MADDVRQTFTEHLEEMTTDGIRHRGVDGAVIGDARAEAELARVLFHETQYFVPKAACS